MGKKNGQKVPKNKNKIDSYNASPGFAGLRYMAPGTDWRFLPFWRLFGNFLAHFDPWTICDNSLQ